jgi:hypothetical protein
VSVPASKYRHRENQGSKSFQQGIWCNRQADHLTQDDPVHQREQMLKGLRPFAQPAMASKRSFALWQKNENILSDSSHAYCLFQAWRIRKRLITAVRFSRIGAGVPIRARALKAGKVESWMRAAAVFLKL